ncbi:hypothetical protein [Nevskia ramosa]|uniref:hypothetical protein n=1 Tax=Nevskia ramosa TaxID=64002 RepID=UPI003D146F27
MAKAGTARRNSDEHRDRAVFDQSATAHLVGGRLLGTAASRFEGSKPRRIVELKIGNVDPTQRLTTLDGLPAVDETFDELASDPQAQIAKYPRLHLTVEVARRRGRRCELGHADSRW